MYFAYLGHESCCCSMKEFFRLVFCIPWARILLLFEAFGSVFQRQSSKRFRSDSSGGLDDGFSRLGMCSCGPKDCFLWIPKVTWKSFLDRVLAVFGSCPDGVWDFSHLRLPLVFCCSRLSVAVFQGHISRGPKGCFLWIPKVTWKSFLDRVLAVFGSCPDGVWDFSHLRLYRLCFAVRGFRKRCSKARFREAQKIVFCGFQR